jgi:hypothetical protein
MESSSESKAFTCTVASSSSSSSSSSATEILFAGDFLLTTGLVSTGSLMIGY